MSHKFCIYGGQFGSEGKGAFAEYLILHQMDRKGRLLVLGENSPNSGHTNSKGKTRSLPVSAWYADMVILGPDAAIDPCLLEREVRHIKETRNQVEAGIQLPLVLVHENAALIMPDDLVHEGSDGLEGRVASTLSGGGSARTRKMYHRDVNLTMKAALPSGMWTVVNHRIYQNTLQAHQHWNWLFECSQGLMLDVNLGYYPFVTSRSTHPKVAIYRNGLGNYYWTYAGVHRTFPIRTGGNSGPTGGKEMTWPEVGQPPEIAVVTKRVRRVFAFSADDFGYGLNQVHPDIVAFTHADYIGANPMLPDGMVELFRNWLLDKMMDTSVNCDFARYHGHVRFFVSAAPGDFHNAGTIFHDVG